MPMTPQEGEMYIMSKNQNVKISGFADEIHEDFEIQLSVMKKLGQKYIEFRSADGIGVAQMNEEQIEAYKRRLDEADIQVSAIGSPIGKIMITDEFAPHLETFRHIIKTAHSMKTPYIRMFSFFIPEGESAETYRDEVFRRMRILVDCAKENQVVLLHENEKDIYGDTAPRCRELMEEFYGEHFKCTFDFANFVQCEQDTLEAYHMLKPYISYIHIKDAKKDTKEVVLPGEGDGHVVEILKKFYEESFEGYVSLEPHLSSFALLDQLELSHQEKKELDGNRAYRVAFERLCTLLDEVGYSY